MFLRADRPVQDEERDRDCADRSKPHRSPPPALVYGGRARRTPLLAGVTQDDWPLRQRRQNEAAVGANPGTAGTQTADKQHPDRLMSAAPTRRGWSRTRGHHTAAMCERRFAGPSGATKTERVVSAALLERVADRQNAARVAKEEHIDRVLTRHIENRREVWAVVDAPKTVREDLAMRSDDGTIVVSQEL